MGSHHRQVAALVPDEKLFVLTINAGILFKTKWDIFHPGQVLPPGGWWLPINYWGVEHCSWRQRTAFIHLKDRVYPLLHCLLIIKKMHWSLSSIAVIVLIKSDKPEPNRCATQDNNSALSFTALQVTASLKSARWAQPIEFGATLKIGYTWPANLVRAYKRRFCMSSCPSYWQE